MLTSSDHLIVSFEQTYYCGYSSIQHQIKALERKSLSTAELPVFSFTSTIAAEKNI